MTTTARRPRNDSSTPTTTTGRPATPSPATATPSSPTEACVLDDVDGKPRYFFGDAAPSDHPGTGRRPHAAPPRGALRLLRRARATRPGSATSWPARTPPSIPNGSTVTPACACMDEQGVEAAWLFPSQGVCMEGPDAARHRGLHRRPPGLQPLARGGLGLRLPEPHLRRPVPHPVRPRPGRRASSSGASIAAPASSRSATAPPSPPKGPARRPIRCSTRSGPGSQEAGIVVTAHAGFEDGYVDVERGRRPRRGAWAAANRCWQDAADGVGHRHVACS